MDTTIRLPRPHAAQEKIKNEARRFNVVCCGRRFGKSTLGCDLAIETALAGYPAAWFSDKFASLDNPWRDLKRILRPAIREKNETLRRIDLVTGGSIKMWSLEDDPECSRGPKYKRIVVDEAAKCSKLIHAWREAIRANLADYRGDAWFLSTPKGRNDFWQLFQYGQDELRPEWACWQMGTGANPFISPEEIEAMRQEMGAVVASQEIDAQFLEVGGRFFDEWDEARHTCLPFDVPRHWHFFGGIDYGTRASSPTFCFLLLAADERGNVYVIDEVYRAGALPMEQADAVAGVIGRYG
ncbi:MAG TPA: terminase family protein, partial [Capsulimonadaceae bacterium]|nr:terminase family protein [Capsulimonadaceae bacterium]